MKMKKIKDIINTVDIIESGDSLFYPLSTKLKSILTTQYNIDTTVYDNSIFNKLFSADTTLAVQYYIEHSNEKYISPLFNKLLEAVENEDISESTMYDRLSLIIANYYALKWWKICEAITTEYKPLENYDLNEIRNVGTDVNVHQESESGIYGFNSTESQPTATGNGDNHTTGLKASNEEELRRHGNIGVTSSQQMLESELKLRQYNFIEEVFNDIDKILCLKIY